MAHLEVDGRPVEVPDNSTIMDAANKLGIYVPHFCYHKKLSIAANCRMCLVQVEKAPKPLPACATPATEGMKVYTHSEAAIKAQQGVMEFLLINHPLDCPICDQGGECQLQDLAVGYGSSSSRYQEPKRVVTSKDLGPLVCADEMTRCIHCTRCVRFGQEIAGVMELGLVGRGEHAEIMPFVARTVDSEVSGNMIDVCPVGALTSKPFRYKARTWELARRKSISPHDALGSNLVVQVKDNRVMRVLPLENDDVNECWLSDRDRFSYDALNSPERLTTPMVKRDGKWEEADWASALEFVAAGLRRIRDAHGGDAVGALASPQATLEELYLFGKFARALGSGNVDFRLRQADFSADGSLSGAPWLGMKVTAINSLDRVLVVGSTLRKEQPLLAQRFRQAVKKGAQFNLLNPVDDDLLMRAANKSIVAPSALPAALGQVLKSAAEAKAVAVPAAVAGLEVSDPARAIAASLVSGSNRAIFLGNLAQHHPQAAQLHRLARELAKIVGANFGFLGEAANSVGGYLAGALPFGHQPAGLNAAQMLIQPRRAYLILHAEADLDTFDPRTARAAMHAAELVVVISPFRQRAADYAQVLLPVSPFTETPGTFVNTEGRVQSFQAAVRPLGETRPAWKVLRVLGTLLDLPGFAFDDIEQLRAEWQSSAGDLASRLSNEIDGMPATIAQVRSAGSGRAEFERIAEVPIYHADAIVRRAESLQQTRDAQVGTAWLAGSLIDRLGLRPGDRLRVMQGGGEATLPFGRDDSLPADCVRLPSGCRETAGLGAMFGPLQLERAATQHRETA
ncbi:MAG TPA: NADH-quinone oxidoreductase subunit NuoG [Burkholderiales bacterium]|nr:NADH-quinone oxidoreductase subunit NuoG [Burkholderiales bacterium]